MSSALTDKDLRRLPLHGVGGYNSPFPDLTGVEMGLLQTRVLLCRAILVPKARLAIENLALRQQVAV